MLYIVAGTYQRYLKIIEKFNFGSMQVKYANGLHMLSDATNKDFYFEYGLVTDRKDYNDIIDKIKQIGLEIFENESTREG